ncbi:Uncharacterized membrane protein [Pilibacter termitis]|uniref:Uncharacterized membrane protein n=1 Tax=Pilibacter termitis TaxID=263852 RepID=A0A1T4LEN9_9ENTE|nr:QueT transporter family protein [Pilibacter termitis]SJZ52944.1 Uncharacterized membrane protein [Pilibacter termitis]
MEQTQVKTNSLVKVAIVAALYVAISFVVAPIASGAIQFRIAEMFNFLAFYNKRYIFSVTIGCMIFNFLTYGIVDVIVGGGSTLIFVTLGTILFKSLKGKRVGIGSISYNLQFLVFAIFFSLSMITIALELHYLFKEPLLLTWATTAIGEFLSLLIGGWIIEQIGKRVDLTL